MYNHVGLPLGTITGGADLWMASDDNPTKDSLPGAILFYRSPAPQHLNANWTNAKISTNGDIASHTALLVNGGIVDTNCGTPGYAPPYEVHKHTNVNDPLGGGVPGNPGRTPQNPALDIRDRTPQQLADLDAE